MKNGFDHNPVRIETLLFIITAFLSTCEYGQSPVYDTVEKNWVV